MDRETRVRLLRAVIASRIVVLDGGMGTSIQDLELNADDFGGAEYEGCNEFLNITNPHAIRGIHRSFLQAARPLSSLSMASPTGRWRSARPQPASPASAPTSIQPTTHHASWLAQWARPPRPSP
jgi:S-methylmethionine-dependent homocysteine/selenocysteine methylase